MYNKDIPNIQICFCKLKEATIGQSNSLCDRPRTQLVYQHNE